MKNHNPYSSILDFIVFMYCLGLDVKFAHHYNWESFIARMKLQKALE